MVLEALEKVDRATNELELPIGVVQTTPEVDDTFFVNLRIPAHGVYP